MGLIGISPKNHIYNSGYFSIVCMIKYYNSKHNLFKDDSWISIQNVNDLLFASHVLRNRLPDDGNITLAINLIPIYQLHPGDVSKYCRIHLLSSK